MGRFMSATGQFLSTTHGQFSCPHTGTSRCPLTFEFCHKGNQFIDVASAHAGYVHDDTSQHEAHSRSRTARILAWISRQCRDDLTEQIEELTALRDNFSSGIGCGCLSLTPCPYSNPADVLGRKGPGAQRLRK